MDAYQTTSVQAEVRALKQQLLAKDLEIERIVAEKDAEVLQLKASKDQEIAILKTSTRADEKVYHVLQPALGFVRWGYVATCDLPLVGRFVKFGMAVADVGVRRMTPWENCADLDKKIGALVPYLDENVISPQIHTYQSVAIALCAPVYQNTNEVLGPYLEMARIFSDQAREQAAPLIAVLSPYVSRLVAVARPLSLKCMAIVRPLADEIEEQAEVVLCGLDASAQSALQDLSPEDVFDKARENAECAVAFAKEHAGDIQDAVKLGADLVSDVAQVAAPVQSSQNGPMWR